MLREASLLRSQHGYAFLKIVCCSPLKSGTDPRTGLALFGHRPKDRSRVVQGTDLRTGLAYVSIDRAPLHFALSHMFGYKLSCIGTPCSDLTSLDALSSRLGNTNMSLIGMAMDLPAAGAAGVSGIIMVAQLWFGMRIPRPRLPSCNQRGVR